jgi:hypothetical protein
MKIIYVEVFEEERVVGSCEVGYHTAKTLGGNQYDNLFTLICYKYN